MVPDRSTRDVRSGPPPRGGWVLPPSFTSGANPYAPSTKRNPRRVPLLENQSSSLE